MPDGSGRRESQGAPMSSRHCASNPGRCSLELQNQCPFRAYAELRLGSGELGVPEPGEFGLTVTVNVRSVP